MLPGFARDPRVTRGSFRVPIVFAASLRFPGFSDSSYELVNISRYSKISENS